MSYFCTDTTISTKELKRTLKFESGFERGIQWGLKFQRWKKIIRNGLTSLMASSIMWSLGINSKKNRQDSDLGLQDKNNMSHVK